LWFKAGRESALTLVREIGMVSPDFLPDFLPGFPPDFVLVSPDFVSDFVVSPDFGVCEELGNGYGATG
jgi:hypothetical protein